MQDRLLSVKRLFWKGHSWCHILHARLSFFLDFLRCAFLVPIFDQHTTWILRLDKCLYSEIMIGLDACKLSCLSKFLLQLNLLGVQASLLPSRFNTI